MAFALAMRITAITVVALALAGTSSIQPARAQSGPTFTVSPDSYLLNICDEVTFTIVLANQTGGSDGLYLYEIDEQGDRTMIKAWGLRLNGTLTYEYQNCEPGRFTYQAEWKSKRSNTLVLQWLHPAEGGTERVRTVSDGGAYTNVAPVITNLDYDVPEAVTSGGATSFNASVLVKWSAVPRATGYEIVGNSPSQEVTRETTDTEAAATQALVEFTDIYPNDERSVQTTFQVRAFLDNGESSTVILDTGTGSVAVDAGAKVYSPRSETASIVVGREGNAAPIDTETPGDPGVVEPGAAVEGINDIALMIAEKTGMGSGASTALLPLLCLLLAGVATAVVVVPLGFSPLSLFAGFLVFTLVWGIGGPAWFGIPIPMAVLFPVILAACGAMIVRGRGMFG